MVAAARWLLLLALALQLSARPALGATESAEQCTTTVSSQCLESLRTSPGLEDLLHSFDGITDAVLRCVSAEQQSANQTLRLSASREVAQLFKTQLKAFSSTSGWLVPVQDFSTTLNSSSTGAAPPDVWLADPMLTVTLATLPGVTLQPLSRQDVAGAGWSDLYSVFATSSRYNGAIASVPLAGDVPVMLVRPELVRSVSVNQVETWQTLLDVAAALNGTDLNHDGKPDFALCLPLCPACGEGGVLLSQVLASMTQTLGTQSGWMFDPANMQPLFANQAMREALRLVAALSGFSWPSDAGGPANQSQPCSCAQAVSRHFLAGECAVALGSFELFKLVQRATVKFRSSSSSSNSTARVWAGALEPGWYSTARPLGSAKILDRSTGLLAECTVPDQCPWADVKRLPLPPGLPRNLWGSVRLVNRAPLMPSAGLAAFLSTHATAGARASALDLVAALANSSLTQVVLAPGSHGPCRVSQLALESQGRPTPAARAWEAAGLGSNVTELAELLRPMNQTLASGNVALWVRIQGRDLISAAMQAAATQAMDGVDADVIMQTLAQSVDAAVGLSGPAALGQYRASLNLAPLRPPTPPSPPPPQEEELPWVKTKGFASGMALICVAVVFALLLFLMLATYKKERRRRWGLRTSKPPTAGPTSTLLVTDIESSTLLWESVAPEAVNRSVELHHALVRQLLRKQGGYESATEGDSFIAAFHTPGSAMAFAEMFQLDLLEVEWPQELLESPLACTVWARSGKSNAVSLVSGLRSQGAAAIAAAAAPHLPGRSTSLAALIHDSPKPAQQGEHLGLWSPAAGLAKLQEGSASAHLSDVKLSALALANASSGGLGAGMAEGARAEDGGNAIAALFNEPFDMDADAGPKQRAETPSETTPRKAEIAHSLSMPRLSSASFTLRADRVLGGSPEGGRSLQPPSTPTPHTSLPFARDSQTGSMVAMDEPHASNMVTIPDRKRQTVLDFMRQQWKPCMPPATMAARRSPNIRLVFRGLRVRVGMHTGIEDAADAVMNKTTGRMQYGGLPLALAKAVADSGHGGMILLSQATFEALPLELLRSFGLIFNMGTVQFSKASDLPPTCVYQVVVEELEPRLAVAEPRMRAVSVLESGVLDAPVGHVTVAFVNIVGFGSLMAWNREEAQEALRIYEATASALLVPETSGAPAPLEGGPQQQEQAARAGYLVEMSNGLCLAAFDNPALAIQWGLNLIECLKGAAWSQELLAHELCEQVAVQVKAVNESAAPSVPSRLRTSMHMVAGTADSSSHGAAPGTAMSRGTGAGSVSLHGSVHGGRQYHSLVLTDGREQVREQQAPQVEGAVAVAESHQAAEAHMYRAAMSKNSTAGQESVSCAPGQGRTVQVLFRGPRLKAGIDVGPAHATVSPVTGRMTYRGRVMNRAARVAEKAGSGQVWCSASAWAEATEVESGEALAAVVDAQQVGVFRLKGVNQPMQLVHCSLIDKAEPEREAESAPFHAAFGGLAQGSLQPSASRRTSPTIRPQLASAQLERRSPGAILGMADRSSHVIQAPTSAFTLQSTRFSAAPVLATSPRSTRELEAVLPRPSPPQTSLATLSSAGGLASSAAAMAAAVAAATSRSSSVAGELPSVLTAAHRCPPSSFSMYGSRAAPDATAPQPAPTSLGKPARRSFQAARRAMVVGPGLSSQHSGLRQADGDPEQPALSFVREGVRPAPEAGAAAADAAGGAGHADAAAARSPDAPSSSGSSGLLFRSRSARLRRGSGLGAGQQPVAAASAGSGELLMRPAVAYLAGADGDGVPAGLETGDALAGGRVRRSLARDTASLQRPDSHTASLSIPSSRDVYAADTQAAPQLVALATNPLGVSGVSGGTAGSSAKWQFVHDTIAGVAPPTSGPLPASRRDSHYASVVSSASSSTAALVSGASARAFAAPRAALQQQQHLRPAVGMANSFLEDGEEEDGGFQGAGTFMGRRVVGGSTESGAGTCTPDEEEGPDAQQRTW